MLPYSPVKLIRTFSHEDKVVQEYSPSRNNQKTKEKREKIIIDKDTLKKSNSFSRDPFY